MRISSKVALSSGLLVVILITVLGFSLAQVRRVAEMQRGLAEIELQAAMTSLDQQRLIQTMENLIAKYFINLDPEYHDGVTGWMRSFEAQLEALEALALTERAREECETLRTLWETFAERWDQWEEVRVEPELGESLPEEDLSILRATVADDLEAIRSQVSRVTEATREAIEQEADKTFEAARRAQTFSWIVVAAALALAGPILWVTIWSIRDPLKRLEEGTRSIARGVYSYTELDASRQDEFADIAVSFNEMVARLGELDQLKRDFLSHVSHELRTPLVAMDETNRLLLEELPGPLTKQQRQFLEINLEGSRRLADMISKLLDLARLEERAVLFELQTNDLVEVATGVADSFHAHARDLGVALSVEPETRPITIECDADRIVQLLNNLLDNALKHTEKGGRVSLQLGEPNEEGYAAIRVCDTGLGIPDAEKQRVFEKFHQIGRPRTGGVGLGLAICQQIVDAHRGSIWVEDNEGGGAVFAVALPSAGTERRAQAG